MAIIDVVKYEGNADELVFKFPNSELSTWTQLIVNESQEAIFFKDGWILDSFGAGRYVLDTNNIPLLVDFLKIPFGGSSPFAAEVWFVNKRHMLDIKWGTPTPIQIQDPVYQVMIPVRSHGQFGIQITNGREFVIKLVGTLSTFSKEDVVNYFKGVYITKVKDAISTYLFENKVSILQINAHLEEISAYIEEKLSSFMAEYGVKLINFNVNDISIPEDDPAVIQLKAAFAKKAEMNVLGYDYTQERSFDVLEGAAKNEGSAQSAMMGAGLGFGMGMGVAPAFGQGMADMSQSINTASPAVNKKCQNCGSEIKEDMKFCPECGQPSGILCPKCQQPVIENAKFCPSCGESLVKVCSNCQAPLDPGVKFCPECGQKNE